MKRSVLLVLSAVLATAVFSSPVACKPSTSAETRPPADGIVLITIDSLRTDRLDCYEGKRKLTPAIDALASQGVRFDRAYVASPSTIPSNATILSGLDPAGHGLRHDLGGRLPEDVATVAQRLEEAGYATGAVVGSQFLDSDRGFDRGFGLYDDEVGWILKTGFGRSRERRAQDVVDVGLRFLDTIPEGKRFFLWLNFHDPAYDYDPPEDLKEQFASEPYDGEVAHVDAAVKALTSDLRKRGLQSKTDIVLVGSHGAGLGDHGETGHGTYLYETTIRVPLVIAAAGSKMRQDGDVDRPVGLVDLAPTILDLAGLERPAKLDGQSLLPDLQKGGDEAASGGGEARRIFVEAVHPHEAYGWSPLFAVIEGSHKIVKGRYLQAFDLAADPGEVKPLEGAPAWAGDLESTGEPLLGTLDPPEALRREVDKRARAMELPWDNSPICLEKQNWPDPRDPERLALSEPLIRASNQSDQGVVGWALKTVQNEVLDIDPANFRGLDITVFLYIRQRWRSIIEEPLELFQCNYPYRGTPYHYLGHYYLMLDEVDKAGEAFELFRLLSPGDNEAPYDLAQIHAIRGEIDAAFDLLERAIDLGADDMQTMRMNPRLAPLRDDPRFDDLLGGEPSPSSEGD